MPSIHELFGLDPALASEGEGNADFDIDKLFGAAEEAIPGHRSRVTNGDLPGDSTPPPSPVVETEPAAGTTPPPPVTVGGEDLGGDEEEEPEASEAIASPPVVPQAVAEDPIAALLREALGDPERRARVLGALAGEPTVAPPAAPALPEEIDPRSPEAALWMRQNDVDRKLAEIAAATKAQSESLAKQQANNAANAAGAAFAARYQGKLDAAEVIDICRIAGSTGIAARFATGADDLQAAFEESLEHVAWTNEGYRAKLIGQPAAPPVVPGNTPQAQDRKRKLTALSSSASPVSGPAPGESPLETRTDGRLTEKSRMSVVQQAASAIARTREGSF
jgi:hypothetical protein